MRTAERSLQSAEQPHEPPSAHRGGSAERGARTLVSRAKHGLSEPHSSLVTAAHKRRRRELAKEAKGGEREASKASVGVGLT